MEMDQALVQHAMAIGALALSEDIETVRSVGSAYAKRYIGLIGAASRAYETMLVDAAPEELATIERCFQLIGEYELEADSQQGFDFGQ